MQLIQLDCSDLDLTLTNEVGFLAVTKGGPTIDESPRPRTRRPKLETNQQNYLIYL